MLCMQEKHPLIEYSIQFQLKPKFIKIILGERFSWLFLKKKTYILLGHQLNCREARSMQQQKNPRGNKSLSFNCNQDFLKLHLQVYKALACNFLTKKDNYYKCRALCMVRQCLNSIDINECLNKFHLERARGQETTCQMYSWSEYTISSSLKILSESPKTMDLWLLVQKHTSWLLLLPQGRTLEEV